MTVGRQVPATGHEWIATLPPVVLDHWPVADRVELDAFTTVANFRGYGSIEHDGVRYGQKAHSLRPLLGLPRLTGEHFALALDIHPDEPDLATLREHGWGILDPRRVAGTPESYASFVRGSKAELGIAKEGYVVSRCGWFSDRSAAYLASGRPVVAQDTGFGEALPTGAGLFAFSDPDGVLAALEAIRFDYGRHARAARAIAEEHLDSGRVLTRLLREVGAESAAPSRSIHEVTDAELAELLGARSVRRRPFEYRSSAPMAELEVDGRTLLLKDLSPSALTGRARAAKLEFLHDPRRELEVYRSLLDGADLGTPELAVAVSDPDRDRYWLVIEKVRATELYQVGELERWQEALRWLAGLHDHFVELRADRLPGPLRPVVLRALARAGWCEPPGLRSGRGPTGCPADDAHPRRAVRVECARRGGPSLRGGLGARWRRPGRPRRRGADDRAGPTPSGRRSRRPTGPRSPIHRTRIDSQPI